LGRLISPYNGHVYPPTHLLYGFTCIDFVKFLIQAFGYIKYVKNKGKKLNAPGYLDIEKDWSLSFSSCLDKHKMSLIKRVFYVPICCYGYGHLEDIPAAYALKYMNEENFMTFFFQKLSMPSDLKFINNTLKSIFKKIKPLERIDKIGYQGLLEKMADTFPDNIMCGKTITKIERKDKIKVHFSEGLSEEFDKLIIALPPFTNAKKGNKKLLLLNMDLFEEETMLFQNIKYFNFCTFAIDIKPFHQHGYAEIVGTNKEICVPKDGWPAMFYQRESYAPNQKKIVVFYCYSKKKESLADMEKRLKQNIRWIHGVKITDKDILDRLQWKYFPHVSNRTLKDGFYNTLDDLQGENNTYWIGGLLNFELVENTFHYSHHLVNKIL